MNPDERDQMKAIDVSISNQSANGIDNQQIADEDEHSSVNDSSSDSEQFRDHSDWSSESECENGHVDNEATASESFDVEAGESNKQQRNRAISKDRMRSKSRSHSRSSSTKVIPFTNSQPSWYTHAASIYQKTLRRKPTRKTKSLLIALSIFVALYFWMLMFKSDNSESNRIFSASGKGIKGGREGHAQAGMMLVQMAKDLHGHVLTDCRDHNQVATMSTVAEQVVGTHVARMEALLKGRIIGLSKLFKENTLVVHALDDLTGTMEQDLESLVAGVHTDLQNVQTGFKTIVENNSRDLNNSIHGVYDGLANVLSALELD